MLDVNSGIELLHQGKIDAIMDKVQTVDPMLNQSLLTLESIIMEQAERKQEKLDLIKDGIEFPAEPYEFIPGEFAKTIKYVLEMLKNDGHIPESVDNVFDRAKYANAWIDFCDAVCHMGIGFETTPKADTPDKAIEALSTLYVDDDWSKVYLKPHGISLYRYDPKSPYKDINQELSLPYFVYNEGVFNFSSPVSSSSEELWWYNLLNEAHSRWEKILNIVMDEAEGVNADAEEPDDEW